MKYIKHLLVVFFIGLSSLIRADEGMWLPLLLDKMNEKQMKSLGMKISAKDIYNINSGSLKDAIVSFGGFCTGEVVSSKGLILTNHHCGFDAVQNHSTLDRNYIRDGFWAKTNAEELPNPGLFVTFIVRIEDVSKQALKGVTAAMSESERQSAIDKNINEINTGSRKERYQRSFVRGFFEGNQYYMFITETYTDVRLVGAPPSAIGNFGKDTDNWMWPRHTGDFSMFRIYAGNDNKPAAYSASNVPYIPKKSLSISLDGVAGKDFTMVFGFPGRTMQYLHSAAVEQIVQVNDPAKIAVRDKALAVLDGFMRKDEQVKIQYAAKYAGISNAWKKWQGEVLGLTRTNAVAEKKAYEVQFQARVDGNPAWKQQYGGLLNDLQAAYDEIKELGLARDYYLEIASKIELFTVFSYLDRLGGKGAEADVKERLAEFYKEYNPEVDKKLFEVLMEMYVTKPDSRFISPEVAEAAKALNMNFAGFADDIYNSTTADDVSKILAALEQNPQALLNEVKQQKAYTLHQCMVQAYSTNVATELNVIQDRINGLQRVYMQAQMEVFKEKAFYPDANSTLRLTYGNVKGYNARDGVNYDYYTYLDGVMEKYIPGDYEFDVPEKLKELYAKKDYGQYGKKGKMPVCFIAANHTTGGNSGSPALDAYGNLLGINFDRVWEGTMSDINYDPSICRNIMVDIRYVLFIIDKYAGAGHLVKEMKLVHPKAGK